MSANNFQAIIKAEVHGQMMEIQMEGKVEGDRLLGVLSGEGLPPMSFAAKKED